MKKRWKDEVEEGKDEEEEVQKEGEEKGEREGREQEKGRERKWKRKRNENDGKKKKGWDYELLLRRESVLQENISFVGKMKYIFNCFGKNLCFYNFSFYNMEHKFCSCIYVGNFF